MKKQLSAILVFAGMVCASVSSFAQGNVIKVNILSPIVRTANFSYERALNESSSLQVGFFYTGFSDDNATYRGFGITPEYRFYLGSNPAPEGAYLAPFVRFTKLSLDVDETDVSSGGEADFTAFGGGLVVGRQWVLKERITMDIFGGPAYNSGTVDVKSGDSSDFDVSGGFDGFTLRLGFTIGVKF